ncbi:MAG: hypothetical protein R6U51_12305, partial [Anaerolineales bacterium]
PTGLTLPEQLVICTRARRPPGVCVRASRVSVHHDAANNVPRLRTHSVEVIPIPGRPETRAVPSAGRERSLGQFRPEGGTPHSPRRKESCRR